MIGIFLMGFVIGMVIGMLCIAIARHNNKGRRGRKHGFSSVYDGGLEADSSLLDKDNADHSAQEFK